MKLTAELHLTLDDEATARAVAAALSPENLGYVEQTVDGRVLSAKASADDPMRLLAIVDDWLASAGAAAKAAKAASRKEGL